MSDDLATIEQYQFVAMAETARIALQAEGVDAFLTDAETLNTDWMLGNAIGYVKLQVPRSQVAQAEKILASMQARREARNVEPGAVELEQCLSCGAHLQAGQSTCNSCGWSYSDDAVPESDEPADASETDQTPIATISVTDWMLQWKRPLIILFLIPIGGMCLAMAMFALMWLCQLIAG